MKQLQITKQYLVNERQIVYEHMQFVQARQNGQDESNSLKMLTYEFQFLTYLHNKNKIKAQSAYDKLVTIQTDVLEGMFEGKHSEVELRNHPDNESSYIGTTNNKTENIRNMRKNFQDKVKIYNKFLKASIIDKYWFCNVFLSIEKNLEIELVW